MLVSLGSHQPVICFQTRKKKDQPVSHMLTKNQKKITFSPGSSPQFSNTTGCRWTELRHTIQVSLRLLEFDYNRPNMDQKLNNIGWKTLIVKNIQPQDQLWNVQTWGDIFWIISWMVLLMPDGQRNDESTIKAVHNDQFSLQATFNKTVSWVQFRSMIRTMIRTMIEELETNFL